MHKQEIVQLIEALIENVLDDRIKDVPHPVTRAINAEYTNGKIMGLVSVLDAIDMDAFIRVYEKYTPVIEENNDIIETLYHRK